MSRFKHKTVTKLSGTLRFCRKAGLLWLAALLIQTPFAFSGIMKRVPTQSRQSYLGREQERGQLARPALQPFQETYDTIGATIESSLTVAFADQGQNINGILFQASLLPYLLFLYFLNYRGNNTPPLVQYAFSFLLVFVIATIPTGIISKSSYGLILADSDWLHGSAESLLTCTNIMLVLGFRAALSGDATLADSSLARNVSYVWLAAVVITLATGISVFGFEAHTAFLSGVGALSLESALPEPANALSLPTWLVHWSSVFEFLIAMSLAWRYADAVGNTKWKGLTWGMLPSAASSICAVTFHIFYNQIPWILTGQAAFTFIGNTTLFLAAFRIAVSNGWSIAELDPRPLFARLFSGKLFEAQEGAQQSFDIRRVTTVASNELIPAPLLVVEVLLLTVFASYATKYGELAVAPGTFQSPDSTPAAILIILLPLSIFFYTLYSSSPDIKTGKLPQLALEGALATGQREATSEKR